MAACFKYRVQSISYWIQLFTMLKRHWTCSTLVSILLKYVNIIYFCEFLFGVNPFQFIITHCCKDLHYLHVPRMKSKLITDVSAFQAVVAERLSLWVTDQKVQPPSCRCWVPVISVILTVIWLLVSDGMVWIFQKLLISWDFHTQQSLMLCRLAWKKLKITLWAEGP